MPTTGRLYATSASGWTGSAAATGAPDGVTTTSQASALVVGGFGAQSAIGAQPTSIDAVRVGVRASGQNAGVLLNLAMTAPTWSADVTLTASLADHEVTIFPTPTWAQLAALEASITRNGAITQFRYVDAVWIEVDYTTSVSYPVAFAVSSVSAIAVAAPTLARPLAVAVAATSAVGFDVEMLPGGLSVVVESVSTVSFGLGVEAGLVVPVAAASSATAAVGVLAGVAFAVPAVSTVTIGLDKVEIRIIRPPARTIAELVGSSTIRRDHVVILDGTRAGESLPIVGGELLLDETADIHATGSLELPPEEWLRDYLDPLRTRVELRVVLALEGDDGTVHEWPRAIVHATDMPVRVSADGGLSLSVQVADRADWVAKRGMDEPYAGSGSLSLMAHVTALVARYAPWLPVGDLTDPGYRSGTDLLIGAVGEDPWEHAVQLAWTAGQRLYIDADGRLSSRPVLAADVEVARWVEGEDECLIADMSTSMSDADVCNRLGVPWEELEPEDAPEGWTPRGGWEWWEDATGPLGTSGPLGIRARAYSGDASVIHSPAHARDVAMSHGLAQQGVQLPLDFVVLADPRRQVGDVIRVTRAALGISDELARIQSLRFQLGSALMSGSMGARRIL